MYGTDLDVVVLRMVHHRAGQSVETDKVCDVSRLVGILNDVALNDVFLRDEPVKNVRRREYWRQVKFFQIIVEQNRNCLHVRGLEVPDARSLGGLGQFVQFEMSLHGHVPGQVAELHLYQLLGVDGPVPVPAGAHWLGQDHTSSVHSLGKTFIFCKKYIHFI